MSPPVNPVPLQKEYGGTLEDPIVVGSHQQKMGTDAGGMMSFDIATGNTQAQQMFEVTQPTEEIDYFGMNNAPEQPQPSVVTTQVQKDSPISVQTQNISPTIVTTTPENMNSNFWDEAPQSQAPMTKWDPNNLYKMPGFDADDQEEEIRSAKLRRNIEEKMKEEDQLKRERREKAHLILTQMESERRAAIAKKKKMNIENDEDNKQNKNKENYKTPWDKIIQNIAIKESDYKGAKDVSRFRLALLNKKSDME